MRPGFLHLDLRRGISADALLSSLIALVSDTRYSVSDTIARSSVSSSVSDTNALEGTFKALGFGDINVIIVKDAVDGIKGQVVQFYLNGQIIRPNQSLSGFPVPCAQLKKPQWHRGPLAKREDVTSIAALHPLLESCRNQEKIALEQLKSIFLTATIKPEISAIAIKILEQLISDRFTHQVLSGSDALWLLCHLIGLVVAIDSLDPKFISATPLHIPADRGRDSSELSLYSSLWLNDVLIGLPTHETTAPIELDVLGVAFIKTLVGHFGPRGESTLLQLGIGFSPLIDHLHPHYVEASWCEPRLPNSMTELGSFNEPLVSYRYQVTGLVPAFLDITSLIATMSLHGAKNISAMLVHTERNTNAYSMNFSVNDEQKREALEAFLVKGAAQAVSLSTIEHHELTKRLVNVPLGKGNKTSSARCYEYTYLDKIVRVEPHQEDLHAYVAATDYSIDVARSDLLMAWKKWRKKLVEESHD